MFRRCTFWSRGVSDRDRPRGILSVATFYVVVLVGKGLSLGTLWRSGR